MIGFHTKWCTGFQINKVRDLRTNEYLQTFVQQKRALFSPQKAFIFIRLCILFSIVFYIFLVFLLRKNHAENKLSPQPNLKTRPSCRHSVSKYKTYTCIHLGVYFGNNYLEKKLYRLISQFETEYLKWTLIITWILLQTDYITFRCYLARILTLQRPNIRISFNMKTTNSFFIMSYVKALWKYVFINMMKLIPTPRRFSCENYTMVETDHWIICSNHSVVWYKTKWRKWGVGRLCFATLPIGEGLEKYDTWDHIVMCWIY